MAQNEPINPKLTPAPAPAKQADKLDASAYAEEIRARREGGIRNMELQLDVGVETPPGWTRRWCNDVNSNIAQRLQDGWRFVSRDQVNMSNSVGRGNEDLGDRVTRTTSVGEGPVKVYLMEIPTEIAEELLEARSYSRVRSFEEAVKRGTQGTEGGPHLYDPTKTEGSKLFRAAKNEIGQKD